jgi:hypothetical protein
MDKYVGFTFEKLESGGKKVLGEGAFVKLKG